MLVLRRTTDAVVPCLVMNRRLFSRLPRPIFFKPYMELPAGIVRPRQESELDLPPPKKQRIRPSGEYRKLKKKDRRFPDKYSSEDVLWQDIVSLLGQNVVDETIQDGTEFDPPYQSGDDLTVEIVALSSTGEALGLVTGMRKHHWAIVTRFCVPGETVRVKVYWNRRLHSYAHLLEVITPNPVLRDDSRVKCKYFGKCGGCQYQVISTLYIRVYSILNLLCRCCHTSNNSN